MARPSHAALLLVALALLAAALPMCQGAPLCTDGATNGVGVPIRWTCGGDQAYYFCYSNTQSKGGCRPVTDGPFPSADCTQQCTTTPGADTVVERNIYSRIDGQACPFVGTGCGDQSFACLLGPSAGGCRSVLLGAWPAADCWAACTITPPPTTPPVCSTVRNTITGCEKTSGASYYWCVDYEEIGGPQIVYGRAYGGCRRVQDNPFPFDDCPVQCSTVPITNLLGRKLKV